MNGLGSSAMTIKYSISSLEEATEYLAKTIPSMEAKVSACLADYTVGALPCID